MGKNVIIGGRIHNPEVGNVSVGANEVLDDTKGKKQNVINAETDAELLRLENEKQDNMTFDNIPTEDSVNPVTSGGVYAADAQLQMAIEAILLLIPSAASALNQLADKSFVNSTVATATATFRGTYNVVTDLGLEFDATHEQIAAALLSHIATADNNDYAFVQIPVSETSTDIRVTERYKFNGTAWAYEYDLNNSGFTASQWAAINSTITQALVAKLGSLPTAEELAQLFAGKQNVLTFDNAPVAGSNNPVKSGGLYEMFVAIDAKMPAGASDNNKLVAEDCLAAYVATIIGALDASYNVTSSDGHVTVKMTQADGAITSVEVFTSDIASASDLTTLTGRVSINESDIANLQAAYAALTQSDVIIVDGALPSSGQQQNVIYRQPDPDHTPPQFYSDYMWNGSVWVLMATYNNAIDNVPTAGSDNLVKSGGVAYTVGEKVLTGQTLSNPIDRFIAVLYPFMAGRSYEIEFKDASANVLYVRISNANVLGENYIYQESYSGFSQKHGKFTYNCENSNYQYLQIISQSGNTSFSVKVNIFTGNGAVLEKYGGEISAIDNLQKADNIRNYILGSTETFQPLENPIELLANHSYIITNYTEGNVAFRQNRNEEYIEGVSPSRCRRINVGNTNVLLQYYIVRVAGTIQFIDTTNMLCVDDYDLRFRQYENITVDYSTGELNPQSDVKSFKVNVSGYAKIKVPVFTSQTKGLAFYDINDRFISGASLYGTVGCMIETAIPSSAEYCRFTAFIDIASSCELISDDEPKNLYAVTNGLLRENGQVDTSASNWYVTHYIPVLSGEIYGVIGGLVKDAYICFYDSSKTLLSQYNYTPDNKKMVHYKEITIPSNVAFFRTSSSKMGLCAYRKHNYAYKESEVLGCIGKIEMYDSVVNPQNGDSYEASGDGIFYCCGVPCRNGDIITYQSGKWHKLELSKNRVQTHPNMVDEYDVVIVGCGSGGIGAAYALKDSGLRVIVVDREEMIGGTVSCGNISNILPTTAPVFFEQIYNKLHAKGYASIRNGGNYASTFATYHDAQTGTYQADYSIDVDREAYASVIQSELYNINFLLGTSLISVEADNGVISSITVQNRKFGGIKKIYGKVFIDCCDGYLATKCNSLSNSAAIINDGYYLGADPKSLYNEANVVDGFAGDIYAINTPEANYEVIFSSEEENLNNITEVVNGLEPSIRGISTPVMYTAVSDNGASVNILIDDGLDAYERANELLVKRFWKYTKNHNNNEYEKYVFHKQNLPGIRELYRIHCENMITQPDLAVRINPSSLGDNIACGTWYVDLHNQTGVVNKNNIVVTNCGIPYGSIVPIYLKNLLVGGKTFGASHIAAAALRITKMIMMVGNAAGYAALQYVRDGLNDVRNVNVQEIQSSTNLSAQAQVTNTLLDNN